VPVYDLPAIDTEWRDGIATSSDVSGGGECGRLRNSSFENEPLQAKNAGYLRFLPGSRQKNQSRNHRWFFRFG
jgi:hypothetical protein